MDKKAVLALLWLIPCCFLNLTAFAENNLLILNDKQTTYPLRNYLEIYFDPSDESDLNIIQTQLLLQFKPLSKANYLNHYHGTTWVKFSVFNPLSETSVFFLGQDRPNPTEGWSLFQKNQESWREIENIGQAKYLNIFFVTLPPRETLIFLMKIHADFYTSKFINLFLQKPHVYIYKMIDRYFISGISYGASFALLLVQAIFLIFFLREKKYLAYLGFILCTILVILLSSGFINRAIPTGMSDWLYIRLIRINQIVGSLCFVLFTKYFLNTHIFTPRIDKWLNYYLMLGPLFLIIAILPHQSGGIAFNLIKDSIGLFYLITGIFLALISSISTTIQGSKIAKYYLASIFPLLIGCIIYFLTDIGIFPDNFILREAFLYGFVFHIILQAITLAVRVNLITESKIKTQSEVIHQKKIYAELQNHHLTDNIELVDAYARFFPSQFLASLGKNKITEIGLGNEVRKDMTILFIDLAEIYTRSLKEESSIFFLNHYLGKIGQLVRKHNGIIEKYVGDSILALFDEPHAALQTAIQIYNAMRKKDQTLAFSQSIHIGPVMLGTIGESKRMDCTVIGDSVNIAARMQYLVKFYGSPILVSEETIHHLNKTNTFHFRIVDELILKGKTTSLKVYELFDIDSPNIIAIKANLSPTYDKAIDLFYQTKFAEALRLFLICQQSLNNDKVINSYINRCQYFMNSATVDKSYKIVNQLIENIEVN